MPYAHVRETVVEHDGQIRVEGLPLRRGDRVHVFIIPRNGRSAGEARYPLHGQPIRYDDPFEPAAPPDEWEVNR